MQIVSLIVGLFQANCYLVIDPATHCTAIVDPGGDAELIVRELAHQQATPTAILATHGHPDHVAAAQALADHTGLSKVFMHPDEIAVLAACAALPELSDVQLPAVQQYDEGDQVQVGELLIRVLHTPGHSPGSICLALDEDNALLTGDLIFAGGVGRTDLPGGSFPLLQASLRRIITEFAEDAVLYPGHGPQSTLGRELTTNPWLVDLS